MLERNDHDRPITVVDKSETGLSDHQFLLWKVSSLPSRHLKDTRMLRQWRELNRDGRFLLFSPLVDSVGWSSLDVDQLADLYESTLTAALSTFLPEVHHLCKYEQLWFDTECMRARCHLAVHRRRNVAREHIVHQISIH